MVVTILVLRQGGFATEALHTIFNLALVGSIAGMDASVSSQARGVREALAAIKGRALVRLLTGMGAYMYRQGAPLDEAFPAGRIFAIVRSVIGMNALVSDKIRLPVEALWAG
jgi:hypothetical protein